MTYSALDQMLIVDLKQELRSTHMEARLDAEELIKALVHEKNPRLRQNAAEALGQMGDARSVKPLIAALKDSDRDVLRAAAEALVKIGAPAVEALITELQNNDRHMRDIAAYILGAIGDRRAVKPLIATLKEDSNSVVRHSAASALNRIGGAEAKQALAGMAKR